jgi:hypothetical protein
VALPTSRNRTGGTDTKVHSGDFNDIQDCIIGGKRGAFKRVIFPHLVVNNLAAWEYHAGGYLLSVGGASPGGTIIVPTEPGDKIIGLEVLAYGDAAADCAHGLYVRDTDMTLLPALLNNNDVNRAAAWGLYAPAVTEHIMLDGQRLEYAIDPSAAGYRIGIAHIVMAGRL